jgi:cell division protein FtsB
MNEVSHALLRDIEVKDRRFRFVQTLFFFLVAAMLGVLLLASYKQQANTQRVIEGQTKTLNTLTHVAKQRTDQINDLQKHIDCVVALFQQPNRASLRISDLENCSLEQLQASSASGGSAGNTKSGSVNGTTLSPQPAKPVVPVQQPTAPTTPQPNPIGNGGHTPDIMRILGIPVCVPFTGLCVKN